MAFVSWVLAALVAFVVAPVALADFHLQCTMLPPDECAFAVSYSGHRCVLEKVIASNSYLCQTSDITVGEDVPVEYIETESCIEACGVNRMSVGFSTDDLSSAYFTSKICSSECREECANLVDLYGNIVAGEGITLSELCGEHRRAMLMGTNRMLITTVPETPSPAPSPAPILL